MLREVAANGMTMVLVEQNVAFGLRLVDTAHLLQSGRVVYEGPVADLDRDRLASLLGIGAMLGRGVTGALATRQASVERTPPEAAPARKPAARKKTVSTAKTAPAKKTAVAAKKATPVKKAASAAKAPPAKKTVLSKKEAASRKGTTVKRAAPAKRAVRGRA